MLATLGAFSGDKVLGPAAGSLLAEQAKASEHGMDRAIKQAAEARHAAQLDQQISHQGRSLDLQEKLRADTLTQQAALKREQLQQQADLKREQLAQQADLARQKGEKAKEVPARQLERLAGLRSAQAELEAFHNKLDEVDKSNILGTGPFAGALRANNPWKGSDVADAEARSKILIERLAASFKGGTPTAQEIKNASVYVPSIRDPRDSRAGKLQAAKETIAGKIAEIQKAYGEGGLNTSRMEPVVSPAAPASSATDTAALRKKYGLE